MTTETVVIPASALPPEKGQEYLEQMVARADKQAGIAPVEKAPEKKPETDWEKRYKDLQAEYTRIKQEKPAEKKVEEPAKKADDKTPEKKDDEVDPAKKVEDAEVPPEAKEAKELTDKAGLDWNDLNATFARDGKLTDAHYEALEKQGIPRTMVDQFTAGQVAVRDAQRNSVLNLAGGEEGYGNLTKWAAENLPAEEIASYNATVNGKDMDAVKMAVSGLKARFDASTGIEPKLIQGDANGVIGYASMAEMKRDMADARYATDASFRKQVEDKLRASSI